MNPTTDTVRIVTIAGNSTANDLDTFGGTLSGSLSVSFPDWLHLTYSNVVNKPTIIPTNRPVDDV